MRTPNESASKPRRGRGVRGPAARAGPSAGARILAAIEEATELLRSEGLPGERITVRTYHLPPAPRDDRPR